MRPIFILGSERSGTNLLRRILGSHTHVRAAPPAHLWRHLAAQVPFYGPLNVEDNRRKVIEDGSRLISVEGSHLCWPSVPSRDEIIANCRAWSVTGVAASFYAVEAKQRGSSRPLVKELEAGQHAFEILALYPEARFVYLARDGRDVCSSVRKVPSLEKHVYSIAQRWRSEQLQNLAVVQSLGARQRVHLLRYEDLLCSPERVTKSLCEFLEMPFEDGQLRFFETRAARREARLKPTYWKNLARPLLTENSGNFARTLSNADIELFESVAGDVLNLLGYVVTTTAAQTFTAAQVVEFERQNEAEKRARSCEALEEPGNRSRADVLESIRRERQVRNPGTYFAIRRPPRTTRGEEGE